MARQALRRKDYAGRMDQFYPLKADRVTARIARLTRQLEIFKEYAEVYASKDAKRIEMLKLKQKARAFKARLAKLEKQGVDLATV